MPSNLSPGGIKFEFKIIEINKKCFSLKITGNNRNNRNSKSIRNKTCGHTRQSAFYTCILLTQSEYGALSNQIHNQWYIYIQLIPQYCIRQINFVLELFKHGHYFRFKLLPSLRWKRITIHFNTTTMFSAV